MTGRSGHTTHVFRPPFPFVVPAPRLRMLASLRYATNSDKIALENDMSQRDAAKLGNRIRRRREAAGLSLGALAKAIGVPPSTILRMERGEVGAPDPDKLERLAKALEIDPEDLFSLYPDPKQLPEFAPYLRAKYGMSAEAVEEAEKFFAELETKAAAKQKGGGRGKRAR